MKPIGADRLAAVLGLGLAFGLPTGIARADGIEPPSASAADLEEVLLTTLPRVTSSVAFREQLPEEAPAAVVVLTADDLRASGARTLGEALERLAGFNLAPQERLSLRGIGTSNPLGVATDSGRILLLIDGTRVNDVFTDNFELGANLGLDDVARVEVVKGPGSAVYGTSAYAGVINVVTLQGDERPGIEGRVRAGGDGLTVSTGAGGVRGAAMLSGSARAWVTPTRCSTGSHGEGRLGGAWKGLSATGGVVAHQGNVGPGGADACQPDDPTLEGPPPRAAVGDSSSFAPRLAADDPADPSLHYAAWGAIQGERAFRPRIQGLSRVAATSGHRRVPGAGLDVDEDRVGAEARLRLGLHPLLWATVGGEARAEWADVEERAAPGDVDAMAQWALSRQLAGAYAQVEAGPVAFTQITAGLRVEAAANAKGDEITTFPPQVSPRLGIVTSLPSRTVLKLTAGRAFQDPSLAILYVTTHEGPLTFQANPDLVPEQLTTAELEVRQAFGRGVVLTVNLFRDVVEGRISTVPVEGEDEAVRRFENVGGATLLGAEASLEAPITAGLLGFGNLTILDSTTDEGGDIPLIPHFTANAGLRATIPGDALIFIAVRYHSAQSGEGGGPDSVALDLPGHVDLDARVAVDLSPRWQLSLNARDVVSRVQPAEDGTSLRPVAAQVWLELSLLPGAPAHQEGI